MASSVKIPISKLLLNSGQIEGVPKNPRFIKDAEYGHLKKSIQDDPEMLELRELLVYPFNDKYVVLGGNMRLRALKELGYTEADVKLIPKDLPAKKLRAIVQKDNKDYGSNDWDLIANEWDVEELEDWGIEVIKQDFGDIDSFFEDSEEKGSDEKPKQITCPECGHEFEA